MWSRVIRDENGKIIKIQGYKAFRPDGKGLYGDIMLEAGNKYYLDGEIKYGASGYHLAAHLEHTLRFSLLNYNQKIFYPKIAKVVATGSIVESTDSFEEYLGYYDMYAASAIEIVKFLTRDEIIEYGKCLTNNSRDIFLEFIQLTLDEIELFWYSHPYGNNSLLNKQMGVPYPDANEYSSDTEFFVKKLGEMRATTKR